MHIKLYLRATKLGGGQELQICKKKYMYRNVQINQTHFAIYGNIINLITTLRKY